MRKSKYDEVIPSQSISEKDMNPLKLIKGLNYLRRL